MEFRVLGPLEVVEDARRLAIPSGRQRALLAFLLIHANRVVPRSGSSTKVWGDGGRKRRQGRRVPSRSSAMPLERRGRNKPNGILATDPAGYVLRVGPGQDPCRLLRAPLRGSVAPSSPATWQPPPRTCRMPSRSGAAKRMPTSPSSPSPAADGRLEEVRLRPGGPDRGQPGARHAARGNQRARGPRRREPAARASAWAAHDRPVPAGRQAEALLRVPGRRHLLSEVGIDLLPHRDRLDLTPRLDGPIPGGPCATRTRGCGRSSAKRTRRLLRPRGRCAPRRAPGHRGRTGQFPRRRRPQWEREVQRRPRRPRPGPARSAAGVRSMANGVHAARARPLASPRCAVGADGRLDWTSSWCGRAGAVIASSLPGQLLRLLLVIDQFEELFTLVEEEPASSTELVRTLSSGEITRSSWPRCGPTSSTARCSPKPFLWSWSQPDGGRHAPRSRRAGTRRSRAAELVGAHSEQRAS